MQLPPLFADNAPFAVLTPYGLFDGGMTQNLWAMQEAAPTQTLLYGAPATAAVARHDRI